VSNSSAGYYRTSLELADLLEDTEALDRWETYTRPHRKPDNSLLEGFRRLPGEGEEGGNVMG
jgi:hypothetical protein